MSDNREVLAELRGLRSLLEAKHEHLETKHEHLDEKLDMIKETGERHGREIGELYDFDRERRKDVADVRSEVATCAAAVQPAISLAKNSKRFTVGFVLSSIGVLGAAFGKSLLSIFKGIGGGG